jgi:hypothetical protein
MTGIAAFFQSLVPVISTTVLRRMNQVIHGILISNGRIMMLEAQW